MNLRLGAEAVENRILSLTGLLAESLMKNGFRVKSPLGNGEKSGILCFDSEKGDAQSIFERLR